MKRKAAEGGFNMKRNLFGVVSSLVFALTLMPGCASESNPGGLTEREVGGLTGAGMGAGTGAIIGSATGNAAAGTAIGAPIGLAAGALAGEGMRRSKEQAKREMREEMMQQQYPQPRPTVVARPGGVESNTMYNPKTGRTFPEGYLYDPKSGEKLEPIKAANEASS